MKRWKPEGLTAMGVLLAALACVAACRLACGPLGPVPHASGDAGRSPYENESNRTRAKRAAAEDVIAGRRTLLDAAAAFRDVDAADPERAQEVAASLSAAGSADEGYCRSVIAWVRAEAPPADADALAGRLEAEVDARLRAGTLRLPGSGGPPSANSE